MKKALRLGVLGVVVAVSACHSGGEAQSPQAPPGQQPIPPPAAFNQHPGYAYYAPGQAAPQQRPAVVMPPALSIADVMNMAHFNQVASSGQKGCSIPLQVAPGKFVHLDCFPYKRVSVASVHATPTKLKMMSTGQIKWNPLSLLQGAGLPIPNIPTQASSTPVKDNSFPDTVDHRLNGTEGPIKDQGDVGSCTSFALSSVMDNGLRRANLNITTSPEHVWSHYATPTMEDAASGNLNKGITTNDALPYSGKEACELMKDSSDDCGQAYNVRPNTASSDGALQSKLRTADAANGHKVVNFEELSSPPNINEIVSVLASGADLWTAFNIDSSVFVNNRMSNFTIPDWVAPDGGHALAMSGYRKVNGSYQFLIHNSWGVSWGDQGYAWVSQNMVQQWMHLAYKVTVDANPGGGGAPVAPQTDEDCKGDQVIDSVTKQCATACSDGSHPANGQCPSGPAPQSNPGALTLPGLGGLIPGMPAIPGWNPQPAPAQPAQPGQPAQQQTPSSWPWPVPSNIPNFFGPTQGTQPKK